jgi:hypothetical protein
MVLIDFLRYYLIFERWSSALRFATYQKSALECGGGVWCKTDSAIILHVAVTGILHVAVTNILHVALIDILGCDYIDKP